MSNSKGMAGRTAEAGGLPSGESRAARAPKTVASSKAGLPPGVVAAPAGAPPPPALFRRVDWLTFGATTVLSLLGYLFTLAPDLTLEDCGELATGSYYAGVPHAPGYPVWTVYSWLFTVIIGFSNVAFRVAVSSAVAAALANGLLGLVVSRGSSMILEGIADFKGLGRRWENGLCLVSGFVAAMLLGCNGFMWSQAIIVEVYCLSVLSLMGVLVCLFHWAYAPQQRRYLYLALFLFGIAFNNHMTLIVAAMGIAALIVAAQPKLGRDVAFAIVLVWMLGLIAKGAGLLQTFDNNTPLYVIYNLVGLSFLGLCIWLTIQTRGLLSEWKCVLLLGLVWLLGASFYLYMPLTSATNPPMNWAYPRTFDGFWHAFTRGQYERTNPTNILKDPWRFFLQLKMYFEGASDEFNAAFLVLALVPFFFYVRMQRRERAWIIGNSVIYLCLGFLLLVLLNPSPDRQSRDLTKVFFTASHVIVAMFLGYGLTLIGAMLITCYERFRYLALIGGAFVTSLALYGLVARVTDVYGGLAGAPHGPGLLFYGLGKALTDFYPTAPILGVYAAVLVLLLSAAFVAIILLSRSKVRPALLLGLFGVIPLSPLVSHWAENEQRGHIFGFWFGHDMFTPPFGLYPEMSRDAVLFGGTDPGRFCPTYMIFCESFIRPEQRRDPAFDRRDVYIITQNALADGTYLNYIRAHYNRSTQIDPPFLRDGVIYAQSVALGREESERKAKNEFHRTNGLARFIGSLTNVVAPLDRAVMKFGKRVEDRRRREGVYPVNEIQTPSVEDSQKAFQEYITDAQRRYYHDLQSPNEPKQIRPGEYVNFTTDGRVQVSGQVAVMAINALLTKVIFDKNPTNEFFVEESFPLDWMYPYLTPFGIIMKINRQPVTELTEGMARRDHEFWSKFSARACGNWITYDTPVKDICEFADRIYLRGNLKGYTGDPRFVRDNDAQKAFSKLRNSIAGLYAWRINESKLPAERARLIKEADFAFKQAFAFCPYSPETVTRYATLLATIGRLDDALLVAQTCRKFDPDSPFTANLISQVQQMKAGMANLAEMQNELGQLEQQYRANPSNVQAAFNLVGALLRLQRTGAAYQILEDLIARTNADAGTLLSVANAFVQLGQYVRVEPPLKRLVALVPDNPEVWYDLAGAQALLGKQTDAILSLSNSLKLSAQRLVTDAKASNLHVLAASDTRFQSLRAVPEFQKLIAPKPED